MFSNFVSRFILKVAKDEDDDNMVNMADVKTIFKDLDNDGDGNVELDEFLVNKILETGKQANLRLLLQRKCLVGVNLEIFPNILNRCLFGFGHLSSLSDLSANSLESNGR